MTATYPNHNTGCDRLLKSSEVRKLLGFSDPSSFWSFVRAQGVPHIRFNSRNIRFEPAAIEAWLDRRRVGGKGGRAA